MKVKLRNSRAESQHYNPRQKFILYRVSSQITMDRPIAPSARPLSLTEELEKLEQSITLTLQGSNIPCAVQSGI
jgi:hypothetical protein